MSRPIEFRSVSEHPAEKVYAATVDPDTLRARLRELGGPGAELLEHTADADGASYRLRHGLDESQLPSLVRTVLGSSITVDRTESWRRDGSGYTGEVRVSVPGMPAHANGQMRLVPLPTGSELGIDVTVSVPIPFVGAKIEQSVGEQIKKLLGMETEFTLSTL